MMGFRKKGGIGRGGVGKLLEMSRRGLGRHLMSSLRPSKLYICVSDERCS